MGKKENKLKNKKLDEIRRNPSRNMRMFRTNAGSFWAGKIVRVKGKFLILTNWGKVEGLPDGYPDMSGWTSITITPDMVGRKVAIFTAWELKATGDLSEEQKDFRKVLEEMGGIYEKIVE